MKYVQIKTISHGNQNEFEKKINEELKKFQEEGIEIIDVKFSVVCLPETEHTLDSCFYDALILYKENK